MPPRAVPPRRRGAERRQPAARGRLAPKPSANVSRSRGSNVPQPLRPFDQRDAVGERLLDAELPGFLGRSQPDRGRNARPPAAVAVIDLDQREGRARHLLVAAPRARMKARAKLVLPLPSAPWSAITSPGAPPPRAAPRARRSRQVRRIRRRPIDRSPWVRARSSRCINTLLRPSCQSRRPGRRLHQNPYAEDAEDARRSQSVIIILRVLYASSASSALKPC